MRVVQVSKPGGPFELVEREAPEPGYRQVRLKVQACGICHSDSLAKEGHFPGVAYPRVPGHEVAGIVDALGEHVEGWQVGERAGVGWFGGNCGHCEACRRGDFIACVNTTIPGVLSDGGYADYMVCSDTALARIPDDLTPAEAAPLMCAGVTTFNALRHSGARAGGVVAILGIGGLGHLGVQYSTRLGYETVAIARGKDKEPLAAQLGAHHYIDSSGQDVAQELQALGGAATVLATATSAEAMAPAIGGLAPRGKLIIVGAPNEPLPVPPLALISGNRSVQGHASGTSMDSQDTLGFSALTGVRPMIEVLPLAQAATAYERMMSNQARFRMVLTTGN
jgi:D-arabinose 1-dehydrogenase-like Zn-dependent alcohol dehydrogenase